MKINQIALGQKIRFNSYWGSKTGLVIEKSNDFFAVLDAETGTTFRVEHNSVISTLENVVEEKETFVERLHSFSFQPLSSSISYGTHFFEGSYHPTGNVSTLLEGSFGNGGSLRIIAPSIIPIDCHKKYRITIEEEK